MPNRLAVVFLDASTLGDGDVSLERFRAEWATAVYGTTTREQTPGRLAGQVVAVTNKVVLDEPILAAPEARALGLIAVTATGTNNVDLGAARERGIAVANVAGYSTDSTAQHTFALVLELAGRAGPWAEAVRGGAWERSSTFTLFTHPVVELAGKTLGIVGYGRIGRAVEVIARGFRMEVLVAARKGAPAPPPAGRAPFEDVLARADILTLHCPLTPETAGLLDACALALMRPTAFLVNTARGGLVDEAALVRALEEGRLAGAALDVLSHEPPRPDHPTLLASRRLPNLVLTPHVAWSAREARERLLGEVAENIAAFARGERRNRLV